MEISNRLRCIGDLVESTRMADIGTDHGYVPLWLYHKGCLQKGIACDIHNGPLERAAENILQAGAENVIETRLGDGLSPLRPGEVDGVVIAGMGGMLMIAILDQGKAVVEKLNELVISPHLDVPAVRRYLHTIGFLIQQEHMLQEDGKYYTVMRAVPGAQSYETDEEYEYGKILLDRKDTVLKEYLEKERKRMENICEKLKKEETAQAKERLFTMEKALNKLQEVQKWL